MIVTTSFRPSPRLVEEAERWAEQLGLRLVKRGNRTISALQRRYKVRDVLVVTEEGLRCYREANPPLFFHPGSAFFRIKRMLATGEQEPLLTIPGVQPGDTIVDCTAGLCSDALTFSYAVGERGRVIAIEADPTVSLIVREGLRTYETELPEVNEAMRRIEVMQGDHRKILSGMPDRSADIVYFDPMFRSPIEESSGIAPLRSFACEQPITAEAVAEARRVARRAVVMKELRGSSQFAKLGFVEDDRRNSKIAYGVIRI
ncbi:hypothetical protein PRECH8_15880 [Insulibacter thermoxylanivorax]|uniref:SAM-dependent methyltransferase n=1 Tax=Insulibacter thermoxylanivorax TaxID=2749268 RepID=A0A916QH53_9BACL|nr:class I SAM-dependent methyltransferase [Insulibacter thermoxylanivorax]GFR38292.1 hypothetical protein PRECH8_15880 [Insulibacter thermoxylanivorax]